ncbi:MAG: hypothetical protein J5905_08165 [Prevotella sp.]|jgi:hypothetical protein|nr:hypothetical protein [Prevotella sp.]
MVRRIIIAAVVIIFNCHVSIVNMINAQGMMGIYTQFSTECLGVEEDGTQTLRAWGSGKNKNDAEDQARKNAVRDVIFKGIRDGVEGCNMKPLVNEPNAREKYEEYFNKFFRDDAKYDDYVSNKDTKRKMKKIEKTDMGVRVAVIVRVNRPKLKERLRKDGIIK